MSDDTSAQVASSMPRWRCEGSTRRQDADEIDGERKRRGRREDVRARGARDRAEEACDERAR